MSLLTTCSIANFTPLLCRASLPTSPRTVQIFQSHAHLLNSNSYWKIICRKQVCIARSSLAQMMYVSCLKIGLGRETFNCENHKSVLWILYVSKLILKTTGNRKGDCAWRCSRWQTQPEKICKSQRTNQCHSLHTLYWFVLCNLQIFSGCACHLEQRHAQSPFLFPIVFSINLIPSFNICSVLAVLSPGLFGYVLLYVLLYLGHCAVATVAVCGFGSWSLVFHGGMARQISPLPPNPLSNRSVLHDGRKHKTVVFSQPNALRE